MNKRQAKKKRNKFGYSYKRIKEGKRELKRINRILKEWRKRGLEKVYHELLLKRKPYNLEYAPTIKLYGREIDTIYYDEDAFVGMMEREKDEKDTNTI